MKKFFVLVFALFFSATVMLPCECVAASPGSSSKIEISTKSKDGVLKSIARTLGKAALHATGFGAGYQVANIISSNAVTFIYPHVLSLFLAIDEGCWFCPVYDVVFSITNVLATTIYTTLKWYFLSFLALFCMAWIFFQIAKMITTLHGPSVGEFITQMFKTLGVFMIACVFLMQPISFLSGLFIDIPTTFILGVTDGVLEAGDFGGDSIVYSTYTRDANQVKADTVTYTEEVHELFCKKTDASVYEDMVMSAALHDSLSCLLKKVSVRLIKGIAMGITFISASFTAGFLQILPSFSMMVVGILITMAYFCLFLQIPILMLNLIVRLGLFAILFPVFVVCFPFPSLRGYTKKGWEMLLSVLINILTLTIFICIAVALLDSAFSIASP